MQPLSGIRVLDFSTLLPGPLATLLLAEAGAEVVKVERPGAGEELRSIPGAFALLNRGKRSIAVDLKDPAVRRGLMPLLQEADVLVEQFRPGVMERLGLGYEQMRAINPRLIYCSITGYDAHGPDAAKAGHDLNYQAEAGVLSLTQGADGTPGMPALLAADIAGGSYPALINILLALRAREQSGTGCRIEIAMFDNLFPLLPFQLGDALSRSHYPEPAGEWLTGGYANYNIYRACDGRHIAVGCFEQKFWDRFCAAIGLDAYLAADRASADTKAAVARILATRDAADWMALFAGQDICCSLVNTLQEAMAQPRFMQALASRKVVAGALSISALPVAVAEQFRSRQASQAAPGLGEANAELLPSPIGVDLSRQHE